MKPRYLLLKGSLKQYVSQDPASGLNATIESELETCANWKRNTNVQLYEVSFKLIKKGKLNKKMEIK